MSDKCTKATRHNRLAAAATSGATDPPTGSDRRRIRRARRDARALCGEIEAAHDLAVNAAFRAELGGVVRSASPVLVSLLALEGMSLDEAVGLLQPTFGWPALPRLAGPTRARSAHLNLARYYSQARISQFAKRWPRPTCERPFYSRMLDRADGGYLTLQVIDHSLEVEASIGPALIESRFGELSIEFNRELPATVFAACVGRLIEEIVDHESWRGRGWRITATTEEDYPLGPRLIVTTGAVGYRMPWAR